MPLCSPHRPDSSRPTSRSRATATRSTAGSTPRSTRSRRPTSGRSSPVTGTALPTAQFSGGQPRKLTLQLLFDSTDSDELDVSDVTARLFKAMEVSAALGSGSGRNSGTAADDHVQLGQHRHVQGGRRQPLRPVHAVRPRRHAAARPGAALADPGRARDGQVEPARAEPRRRTRRRAPTWGSAPTRSATATASPRSPTQHYRDPTRWRAIAEANGIDDPLHLKRGTVLSIPRIED